MAGSPTIYKNDQISQGADICSAGYGDGLNYLTVVGTATGMTGATSSITSLIPAKSLVYGVAIRVITAITASGGGASFTVGDGTTANLFANAIVFAAGTTTDFSNHLSTFAGGKLYVAAANLVFTVNTGAFTAGAIRAVVYYSTLTPPTN